MITLGNTLKEARESTGLSQRDLVEMVNKKYGKNILTRGHLSLVELNKSSMGISKLAKVTTVLASMQK